MLARGMKNRWDEKILKAIEENRLLVIAPFSNKTIRITRETAYIRNQKIVDISNKISAGHISIGGQLEEILTKKVYSSI